MESLIITVSGIYSTVMALRAAVDAGHAEDAVRRPRRPGLLLPLYLNHVVDVHRADLCANARAGTLREINRNISHNPNLTPSLRPHLNSLPPERDNNPPTRISHRVRTMAEEFTLAPMRRLIKKQGDIKISEEAAEEMRRAVGEAAQRIAEAAVENARKDNRKTVLERDIRAARVRERERD